VQLHGRDMQLHGRNVQNRLYKIPSVYKSQIFSVANLHLISGDGVIDFEEFTHHMFNKMKRTDGSEDLKVWQSLVLFRIILLHDLEVL